MLNGGKRLRPLFAIATTLALKGSLEAILDPACALECIHTYSLIHDDLPCMDNDDFRRGLPTCHRLIGESKALLVGDFLLTYAFEILSKAPRLSAETKIELITTLSKASGIMGMIGGQAMDIAKHENHKETAEKKTGALIQASLLFGAIVANADNEMKKKLSTIGSEIGLLYQIADDIVDQDKAFSKPDGFFSLHEKINLNLSTLFGEGSSLEKLVKKISPF